jgi:hypothetical protein
LTGSLSMSRVSERSSFTNSGSNLTMCMKLARQHNYMCMLHTCKLETLLVR